jgi:hypothetical protein
MKPTDYQPIDFLRNNKGLNTRDTRAGMDLSYASDLLNVDLDVTGAFKKRNGYVVLGGDSGSNVVGLVNFQKGVGTLFALKVTDAVIEKMDGFDGTWDTITGAVTLTAGQNNFISWTIGVDTIIGTNGINPPFKYTGTGNAAALSITQFTLARYVNYYKNRAIFLGTTETNLYPNRVRWANVGTIETYTANDYTDECDTADGSQIVGSVLFLDDLYIFKNSRSNGIRKLQYTGSTAIGQAFGVINIGEVGAISGFSIVPVDINGLGSGIVYWGVDNKIRFFNGTESISLSDHIQPTLNALNIGRNKYIQGKKYSKKNQIWFTVSDGTSSTNNTIIIYDYYNNAFLKHDDITANVLAILTDGNDIEYMCSGGYTGYTFRHDSGYNDNTSAYNSYFWSAWIPFGSISLAKRPRWIDLIIAETGSYNLQVGYNYDFNDGEYNHESISLDMGSAKFGTAIFGVDQFPLGTILKTKLPIYSSGEEKFMRLKFYNNNTDEPFTVYGYSLLYKTLGLRG